MKVSMPMALAILATHERKQFGHHANMKEIARRHKVTYGSLRNAYYHFRHGRVEMPVKPTPLDELNDRRNLYEKMRMLSLRLTAMVTNQLEDATMRAEQQSGLSVTDKTNLENERDYRKINSDVMFLMRSLQSALALGGMVDQGYSSHLDEAQRRLNPPPPINPVLPVGAAKQTAMLNAGETARALEALDADMEVTPNAGT